MRGKNAISAIVATVLIILITVAAVTIVWVAIIPMVRDNLEMGTACLAADVIIDSSSGYTCYDAEKKILAVQIKKGPNEVDIAEVELLLGSGGTSSKTSMSFDLGTNAGKVFYFLTDEDVDEVSLAPVIQVGNSEKTCDVTARVNLKSCSLGEAYGDYLKEDGVVGYWRFEGDAEDSAGDNDLDLSAGGEFVNGKIGQAYKFPVVTPRIETNFNGELGLVKSYSFWFKFPNTDNPDGTFLCIEDSNPNTENNLGQSVSEYGIGYYDKQKKGEASFHVGDTEWHMYTFSNSANSLLCLDGECVNVGDLTAEIPNMKKIRFNIGCSEGYGDFAQGVILDEVMIYNKVLSQGEITSIYSSQK